MKAWILLFCLFGTSILFATEEIPHYDRYPRTPIVDYQEDILDFYSVRNAYGEFSNFALFPIVVDEVNWPTSEHYYQAHKYLDPKKREWVRQAATPYQAAKRGRDRRFEKRPDWKEVKDFVMMTALVAKFSQYTVLQELLLSTNDAEIIEHTKNDCYWGDCGDRTGKNKLGKALMEIRAFLIDHPHQDMIMQDFEDLSL